MQPTYIQHEALEGHSVVPFAGAVFDEPEEGDRIYVDDSPYEFGSEVFDRGGQWFERFGWFLVVGR